MHPKRIPAIMAGACIALGLLCIPSYAQQDPFVQCSSLTVQSDGSVEIIIDNDTASENLLYEVYCTEERLQSEPFLSSAAYWRMIHKTAYNTPLFSDQGEFIRIPPSEPSVAFRFYAVARIIDSDNDGLSDGYELLVTNTLPDNVDTNANYIYDGEEDIDLDGLTNYQEYILRTDPRVPDTDNDGLADLVETGTGIYENELNRGTNPLDNDTDQDGLSDFVELYSRDCDGFESGDFSAMDWSYAEGDKPWEAASGIAYQGSFSARVPSSLDHEESAVLTLSVTISEEHLLSFVYKVSSEQGKDVLYVSVNNEIREIISGEQDWTQYTLSLRNPGAYDISFIYQKDADNDSGDDMVWIDNVILIHGTIPVNRDMDLDGVSDGDELSFGTSPYKSDTDGDGIADSTELFVYGTNPLLEDSDLDGLDDSAELNLGTDPVVGDSDNDSIADGWESTMGLNPLLADSMNDSDGDGLSNYEEYKMDSNPFNTYGQDPMIVYVNNAGSGGSGSQLNPYGSLQQALDETSYGGYPVLFVLSDGLYDLWNDQYMAQNGINSILIDQDWLYNTYGDNYCAAIKGSSPDKVIIKGWGAAPIFSILYGDFYSYAPVLVKNVTITNGAKGVDCYASSPVFVNCKITGNKANFGAGMFVEEANPEVINCLITGNTAIQGSGIYVLGASYFAVAQTTIAHNTGSEGIAIYVSGTNSIPTIFNSILWETGGDDIYNIASTKIKYCDIEDGDYLGQNGNISSDPLFAAPDAGNFHITSTSPCRNAGHPFGLFTRDHDNEIRPANSGCDIGFDEFVDSNSNTVPDFWETKYGGTYSPTGDNDSDGVNNATEAKHLTSPTSSDTDGDGVSDYMEIVTYGTDPLVNGDKDGDTVSDYDEIMVQGTNPSKKDTDDDGIPDDWEISRGLDPTVSDGDQDPDGDWITNYEEYFLYTDPYNIDDPYLYYVSDWGSIQATIDIVLDDRNTYGNFVGLIYLDTPGTYSEDIELIPDLAFYADDPLTVTIQATALQNSVTMYSDNDGNYSYNGGSYYYGIGAYYCLFKNISFIDAGRGFYVRQWNLMLNNCYVRNHYYQYSAWDGGGMYAYNSYIELINTIFDANQTRGNGGALFAENSTLLLNNATISDNTTIVSGGGFYLKNSTITSKDSLFEDNRCIWDPVNGIANSGEGGALYIMGNGALFSKADLKNTTFLQNETFAAGGAIFAASATVNFDNVTLSDNLLRYSRNNSLDGYGGGIFLDFCLFNVINSDIDSNTSFKAAGGIYMQNFYGNISDSIISNNSSANFGGGAQLYETSVDFTNVTIDGNIATADDGGGLYFEASKSVIDDCTVVNNTASSKGGGIYSVASTVSIVDSDINDNNTTSFSNGGAGLYGDANTSLTIKDTTLSGNQTESNGGALYLKGGTPSVDSTIIKNNTATHWGGGIFVEDGTPTVRNSVIQGNTAGSEGGGVNVYSSINSETGFPNSASTAKLSNMVIKGNKALTGGGVTVQKYSRCDVDFSVVVDNTTDTNSGGGLYWQTPLSSYPFKALNSIIWGNTDDVSGLDQTTVRFCNIGDGDFNGVNGNISIASGFVNPARGDYHLLSTSQLIDMGTSYLSSGNDADGEARPASGDFSSDSSPRPLAGASDIGLDEFIDSDSDALPDYWENQYGGLLDNDGDGDSDSVTNFYEYINSTNPGSGDTDGDGLSDYNEIFVYFTNPLADADTDLDGLKDSDEINTHGTNPALPDSDYDRMPDGWELANGLNPLTSNGITDSDSDDLTNYEEYFLGTDPVDANDPIRVDGSALSSINDSISSTSKRLIYLPPGTYSENTINMLSGNCIMGDGSDSAIIVGNGAAPLIRANGVSNVIIKNVTLKNGLQGLYNTQSSVAVINCNVINNYGSGLEFHFALDTSVVINSTISGNKATFGGGIKSQSSAPQIINCSIFSNTAQKGAGFWATSYGLNVPGPQLLNSVVYGNVGGGIHVDDQKTGFVLKDSIVWNNGDDLSGVTSAMVSYSNIEDGDFNGENNNISEDPDLGTPQFGRFHLLSTSPGINTGSGLIQYQIDFQGENRLNGSLTDMGTDEFYDTDMDGLGDVWETAYGGNFVAGNDDDGDTLLNADEYRYYTDPNSQDTDGDSLSDAQEANGFLIGATMVFTDPLIADMDGDGLQDGDEVSIHSTDPTKEDTDGDGLGDAWEVANGLDPTVHDSGTDPDNDGLTNYEEFILISDPNDDASPYTVYVDYNTGHSYPGPKFTTIPAAIQHLNDNDSRIPARIYVAEGQYAGKVILPNRSALIGASPLTVSILDNSAVAMEFIDVFLAIVKNVTITKSAQGVYISNANPRFVNCHIINNVQQPNYGGGVYISEGSPTFIDCTFEGNIAKLNGGGVYCRTSYPEFTRCHFNNNTLAATGSSGGGLYANYNSVVSITDSQFVSNLAGDTGGALSVISSTLDMFNTVLKGNKANNTGGGGIYFKTAAGTVFNSYIINNSAYLRGGGIFCNNSNPEIAHSLVYGNTKTTQSGGGIYIENASAPVIRNTILWNNTDDLANVTDTMIQYSNISDGDYAGVNGNISQDPLLVNPENDNYHLFSASPCKNAASALSYDFADLDGESRPYDTLSDIGPDEIIDTDMDNLPDAWELTYVAALAILDNDSDPDGDNLSAMQEFIGGTNPDNADTDGDGLNDDTEITTTLTSPTDSDTDDDGLSDGDEVNTHGTDPKDTDSDNDLIDDKYEVDNSLNPLLASDAQLDPDGDHLTNLEEYYLGSSAQSNTSPLSTYATTADDLQVMIDNAVIPNKIILSPGTYTHKINSVASTLNLKSGIAIVSESGTAIIKTDFADTVFYVNSVTNVVFKNLIIKNSLAGILAKASDMMVSNCSFESNASLSEGAGIACFYGDILVYNSTFNKCRSTSGGAIYSRFTDLNVIDSDFTECIAYSGSGGALYIDGATASDPVTIRNTVFTGNNAAINGGSIYTTGGYVDFVASTLQDNAAHQNGGALFGVYSTISMTNMIMSENIAHSSGGAVYLQSSSSSINHCVLAENISNLSAGGGLYLNTPGTVSVKNSIFSDNTDDLYGVATSMISYCNIGDGDFNGVNGNISVDPGFIDVSQNNYHVQASSSMINAGTPTETIHYDIDGEAVPSGSASDIGIDEFVDSDDDLLADVWELLYAANLTILSGSGNNDSDSLTNAQEYTHFSHPLSADTDGDTLSDGDEATLYFTSLLLADTDGDGLGDADEIAQAADPLDDDSDDDGIPDGWEVTNGLDPNDPSDADGNLDADLLSNYEEYYLGSNPNVPSSPPTLNASGYTSLKNAINAVASPGIVIISAGGYSESLQLRDGVVLYAASPSSTIITAPYGYDIIKIHDCKKVIIKNIKIQNAFANGISAKRGEALISNCIVANNISLNNGGGLDAYLSKIECRGTTFTNNRANANGGGIHSLFSDVKLVNCEMVKNRNYAIYSDLSKIDLLNSDIHGNYDNPGYIVYFRSPIYATKSEINLLNSSIYDNYSSIEGGAVNLSDSFITASNCIFHSNASSKNSGAFNIKNASGEILNSLFYKNSSQRNAGAIGLDGYNNITMMFNSIANNTAIIGAGLYVYNQSNSSIINSIIWNEGDDLYNVTSSMIQNSCIEDGDYAGTNGNIASNPQFRNIAKDDFHLIHTSPCINSGVAVSKTVVDIDNEGHPDIALYDIGADEFVDSDNDGLPDFWEAVYGPDVLPASDDDSDNLTALEEYAYLTDPTLSDTDSDGVSDYDEILVYETDPLLDADKDGDGLTDAEEILTHNTDPGSEDTDGDWMSDAWEIDNSLNPLSASDGRIDADNDGLLNDEEFFILSDPFSDTDPTRVYVDASAPSGGDGSQGSPYKTILTAKNNTNTTSQNAVLILAEGLYHENVQLKTGLSILGASPNTTIITGASLLLDAVKAENITKTLIKNITIEGSYAGINCKNSDLMVSSCIIKDNVATPSYGGGLYFMNSRTIIVDTVVDNNAVSQYGGGAYFTATDPIIHNCTFSNNDAVRGGGIYIDVSEDTKIINTLISGNTSQSGGGVYNNGSHVAMINCRIKDSTATDKGAGIYHLNGSLDVYNSVMVNNRALRFGGGLYVSGASGAMENSVLASNCADFNTGHGVYQYQSSFTIKNSIIWNSLTSDLYGFAESQVISSDIRDASFNGINGNISTDPLFVNANKGDFHLFSSSLCKDAGTGTPTVAVDIDNETRPFNSIVDMGIDEIVDTDLDGLPDYWENQFGQNFNPASNDDADSLDNSQEYANNTNPLLADTDGDGINDSDEISLYSTDPTDADSDDDGASDGLELLTYNSNPLVVDTDNDSLPDSWEGQYGLNPNADDANDNLDGDLLTNYEEYLIGSIPNLANSPSQIYVDNDGVAPGNGTIGSPYVLIQMAIDNAPDPAVISVASGRYVESVIIPAGQGMVIYGDSSNKPEIIGDTINPVVSMQGADKLVILKNLVLRNGKGGLYAKNSKLIIDNCHIKHNFSSGVLLEENLDLVQIVNSSITNNTASLGGGIWCHLSKPFIANCLIARNSAVEGGAIRISSSSGFNHIAPTIVHSTVVDNYAPTGGGIYSVSTSYLIVIKNCVVWGNDDDLYNINAAMISDSNVEDLSFGTNVVSVAPGFGAPQFGKYHITHSSAMIDGGSDTALVSYDIHGELRPYNVHCDYGFDEFVDSDNDTIADQWELLHNANLNVLDNEGDADNDGLSDYLESLYYSNPNTVDTDGDTLGDAEEISPYHTDPTYKDTDEDGLDDALEISLGSNPVSIDSDNDSIPDGWEYQYGLDPVSGADKLTDVDNDLLSNFEEYYMGSAPDNDADPAFVYVDNDAPDGGDGSLLTPYNSISDAVSASVPPYILSLTGHFVESIQFTDKFVIVGNDPETTIIESASLYGPALQISNVNLGVLKNITVRGGKPVILISQSTVLISNCLVTEPDQLNSNGGGCSIVNSDVQIYNSNFTNCTASVRGGALYCENSELFMTGSVLKGNTSGFDGGALFSSFSTVKLYETKVLNNSANHYGGGLFVQYDSMLDLVNTAVAKNSAASGGGIYCSSSTPNIDHCVLYKNTRSTGVGSTLFYSSARPGFIRNTIVWSDDAGNLQQDFAGVNTTIVSYSNVEDDIGSTNNNVSVAPVFAGPDYDNYRLRLTSPCINLGSPASDNVSDFDGETRPAGAASDIGLDEFIDTDEDGLPDFFELRYFGDHSANPNGDPDFDGRLNINEYYNDKNPVLSD
ncbi:MAG: right-handed parallel beta-helix repeat-containing protein [Candidatus Auribacterota bacterium]